MKVTAGRSYFYFPNLPDSTALVPGCIIKVVKLLPPNSCGVEHGGKFAGLVSTSSLYYVFDAIKGDRLTKWKISQ